jgi:thioredoxin
MSLIQPVTADALEARLREPGPIVVDFYQATCAPCRALEPRLERFAQQVERSVPVYRVDADRDMAVAQRFEVTSLPTVVFFREGTVVERLDGLITEAALRTAFDRVVKP